MKSQVKRKVKDSADKPEKSPVSIETNIIKDIPLWNLRGGAHTLMKVVRECYLYKDTLRNMQIIFVVDDEDTINRFNSTIHNNLVRKFREFYKQIILVDYKTVPQRKAQIVAREKLEKKREEEFKLKMQQIESTSSENIKKEAEEFRKSFESKKEKKAC